jgi:hypothetical protein
MGYNARNDEIRDNITRMQREWEAHRDALALRIHFQNINTETTKEGRCYLLCIKLNTAATPAPRMPQKIASLLPPT